MRCPWLIALLLAASGSVFAATGGPDGAGYTWSDSDEPGITASFPSYAAFDLRSQGYVGDEAVIPLPLPVGAFPTGFPFYGTRYPTVFLSSNGWLSFVDPRPATGPNPAGVPNPLVPHAVVAFLWDDWTLDHASPVDVAGANTANDGYTIQVRLARASDPSTVAQVYLTLYTSGIIKVVYFSAAAPLIGPATVIGIENAPGSIGLPYMDSGVAQNGANFRASYAVVFYPPPALDCASATAIACPLATTQFDNRAGANNVVAYNCVSGGSFLGNERVFELTLAQRSNLSITLNNIDLKNRSLFFMRSSCSELRDCISGGTIFLNPQLVPPGTYYIVVDGASATDIGDFTLAVQCQDAVTAITCGSSLLREVTTGGSNIANYSCRTGMTGPERLYELNFPGLATLEARLSNSSSPSLYVIAADGTTFDPANPTCIAADPATVRLYAPPAGNYLLAVDGFGGQSGTYDLDVSCTRKLSCPGTPVVIDVTDPTPVLGNTTGGVSLTDSYYCEQSAFGGAGEVLGYTGPESIYQFTLTSPAFVSFQFSASSPDQRLLILKDCYEGSCLLEGSCGEDLQPGTYTLVVDGQNGASGPFQITPLLFAPAPYNHWWDCPECNTCAHTQADAGLTRWSFNSGNYCGTGCDFALYTVVECGTEFHYPAGDVETGHMKIFNVLEQRYMDLVASNDSTNPACTYTDMGPLVQWEDQGCSSIPCPGATCGGGGDCRTNNVTMDVSFRGAPSVCGVYRLEFINWGGFAWDIFANCSGTQTDQFLIYRDLCTALSNYRPLPEFGIQAVTVDTAQCGSNQVSGTLTIENIGCAAATVDIGLQQATPNPPSPIVIPVTVGNNQQVTVPWSYTLNPGTASLVFQVDPANRLIECSETPTSIGCGGNTVLVRTFPSGACSCINTTPLALGNTLLAAKQGVIDAAFRWQAVPGSTDSGYRLYKDGNPQLPMASRQLAQTVVAPTTTVVDGSAVPSAPSPLAFYQVVGISCLGNLEGPY